MPDNKSFHEGDFVIVLIRYVSEKSKGTLDVKPIDTEHLTGLKGVVVKGNYIYCKGCSF